LKTKFLFFPSILAQTRCSPTLSSFSPTVPAQSPVAIRAQHPAAFGPAPAQPKHLPLPWRAEAIAITAGWLGAAAPAHLRPLPGTLSIAAGWLGAAAPAHLRPPPGTLSVITGWIGAATPAHLRPPPGTLSVAAWFLFYSPH
jgi:hypothetical protein